jgi:hypothetical protein
MTGKGGLYEDTMNIRILVKLLNFKQEILLRNGIGENE